VPTTTATIDFGSDNQNIVTTVTGLTAITNNAEAWMMADSTADHNADEHIMASSAITLTCGNVVAGTSVDVNTVADMDFSGQFTVRLAYD
jgi:isochorismate hydrolase